MVNPPNAKNQSTAARERAILFELETVAVQGRKAVYDAVRLVLKTARIDLAPVAYSRWFLDRSLSEGLDSVIADSRSDADPDKLYDSMDDEIMAWAAKPGPMNPVVRAMLEQCRERSVRTAALCGLGAAAMESLTASLGLKDIMGDDQFLALDDGRSPTSDIWLKLAKQVKVIPPLCVTLTGSMKSAKAAISAGMRCIVIEDEFNAFQDFGGADYVVSEWSVDLLDKALELTRY